MCYHTGYYISYKWVWHHNRSLTNQKNPSGNGGNTAEQNRLPTPEWIGWLAAQWCSPRWRTGMSINYVIVTIFLHVLTSPVNSVNRDATTLHEYKTWIFRHVLFNLSNSLFYTHASYVYVQTLHVFHLTNKSLLHKLSSFVKQSNLLQLFMHTFYKQIIFSANNFFCKQIIFCSSHCSLALIVFLV